MSVYKGIMKGLQEAIEYNEGKITARKVTLSIEPLRNYHPEKIRGIRAALGMTQVLFAKTMGVSIKTVEAWERGTNNPTGPACRILELIERDPDMLEKSGIVSREKILCP